MDSLRSHMCLAMLFFCLCMQAQIKNADFSEWELAEEFGEPYYNPVDWTTTNKSILGQARVSVVQEIEGSNSIVNISSSDGGLDAIGRGYVYQHIPTAGNRVISMWAKCDSLYGNSACVIAIKDKDGSVLQTDTTRVVDNNFRWYDMILDDAILMQYDSITLWIEAQGATDMWDDVADGYSVFLVDEVRATPEPLSFEFLDHRHKTTALGASQEIEEGILYVSNNNSSPMTTVNLASANCDLEVLYELEYLNVYDSHIQVLNDSTHLVILQNFIDYDISWAGFLGLLVVNGEIVEVQEDLFLELDEDIWDTDIWDLNNFIESVHLDTMGNWLIDSKNGLYMYQDSILIELVGEGDLFLNKKGDWFVYDETDLYAYDGTDKILLLDEQDIRGIQFKGTYNYILSKDSLYRYDDQFLELQMKWELPLVDLEFDKILVSDDQVTFLVDDKEEFSIIKVENGTEVERLFSKDSTESLSLLSFHSGTSLLLSGSYFKNFEFHHLFFREFSLDEDNFYDRVDLSLDEYIIEYDSSSYWVDQWAPVPDTTFFDIYDFKTTITNHQDRTITSVGAYSKPYSWVSPSLYLSVDLNENIVPYGSHFSNSNVSDRYAQTLDENLVLHITGANYKFNKSDLKSGTPDFISQVSSIADLNIRAYPNPFSDYLNIESDRDVVVWQLYDMNGRLLYECDDLNTMPWMGELAAGPYVLQTRTENGDMQSEIVVKL